MTALVRPAKARTGCRIDLAGGTLDIWPLGHLHDDATTVNVAVDVPVEVTITPRPNGYAIHVGGFASPPERVEAERLEALRSSDLARFPALLAESLRLPPASIRLASASPRGAGLGASSALGVALVRAADHARGLPPRSARACAAFVRDVEAKLMARPTGTQDHFPPLLGGVIALRWAVGGVEAERLDVDIAALRQRLVVAHSGKSHISGDTNWGVVRRRLDGDHEVRDLFDGIAKVAGRMREAIVEGAWQATGRMMSEEWSLRRRLASGVSTPEIEQLLAAAEREGAWGGKACGAGGGGCVALLVPPERRATVEKALAAAGGVLIDAPPMSRGVEVSEVSG